MKKSRAVIFNIVFQLTIAFLFIDFQINPQHLRPNCITAHANSEVLGNGQIVDCISCHSLNSKDVGDQFIGYASILVPLSDVPSSGLNWRLPFDSTQIKENRLHEQFMYAANLYFQKGCSHYECQTFHILEDFSLTQKENINKLNLYNIQRDDATFKISNYSIPQIRRQLGIGNEQDTAVLETNYLMRQERSSMIVRVRYSVNSKVEGDKEPAVLLYQLQTNIYARFILILVVLIESSRIYASLSHFTACIRNFLFLMLIIGFLSPTTAIISSTLAIYITVAKIFHAGSVGILVALLYALCSLLSIFGRVPFSIAAAFVIIYSIAITIIRMKQKFGFLEFGTLIGFVIAAFSMWNLGWNFYLFLTPLLILSGLLSIREEKESNQKVPVYDLVSFDEQEDVLSKIERELR